MSKSPFLTLLKNVPAMTSIAKDGLSSAEFCGYVDTSSYTLNAVLSGSLFGGMPNNKVTVFAGDSGTGKTYLILSILRDWMAKNPTGVVVYADTESAVTNKMMEAQHLDISRVIKMEPDTIEQFRQSSISILDNYEAEGRTMPMIFVLDSLGNLSSVKEIQDIRDQKDTRDMTKAQLLRGTFRVLRLRLAKLGVAMIVANHTYAVVGCLTDDAHVVYASGETKPIDSVKVGDVVDTLLGPRPVTEVFQYDADETFTITFEDGLTITATPTHKFLTTTGEWVEAQNLRETDEIQIRPVA